MFVLSFSSVLVWLQTGCTARNVARFARCRDVVQIIDNVSVFSFTESLHHHHHHHTNHHHHHHHQSPCRTCFLHTFELCISQETTVGSRPISLSIRFGYARASCPVTLYHYEVAKHELGDWLVEYSLADSCSHQQIVVVSLAQPTWWFISIGHMVLPSHIKHAQQQCLSKTHIQILFLWFSCICLHFALIHRNSFVSSATRICRLCDSLPFKVMMTSLSTTGFVVFESSHYPG